MGAPGIFKILQECPNLHGGADTVNDSADLMRTTEHWAIDNNYVYSIHFFA